MFRRIRENDELCINGFDKLNLPYRKLFLSSGDMGFSAEKTYDLKFGCLLKILIGKYLVVHLVEHFNQKNENKI